MGRILKGSEVRLEGRFLLNVAEAAPGLSKQTRTASAPAVRIIENHPEFAVVEVTCSCGTKTNLRCDYVTPKEQ
ncbi:MAG TPA: hypothetical protein VMX13_12675 [Sedimentisphaerales bacterium]|nr:hypothetical protein [Sedimentisphaerales bacterium]